MDPELFLTEVSREHQAETTLKNYFEQINANITEMDGRLGTMLKRHEQDFFTAFKSHLFQLNTQLTDLKKRHDDNLALITQDDSVIRLQRSMEWFRSEAVMLGDSYKHYKKTAERWKAKAASLEEDKRFLETQVKNARKQNRKIITQLELCKAKIPSSPSTFLTETIYPRTPKVPRRTFVPSTKAGLFLTQLCARVPVRSPEFVAEVEQYLASQEANFKQQIATFKRKMLQERDKIKSENAVQSSLLIEKTDLEELFLECVEEVSREVARSRNKQFVMSRFGKQKLQSTNEQRRVLEVLVSNEPALVLLYERLFPHRAARRLADSSGDTSLPEVMPDVSVLLSMVDVAAESRSVSPKHSRRSLNKEVASTFD